MISKMRRFLLASMSILVVVSLNAFAENGDTYIDDAFPEAPPKYSSKGIIVKTYPEKVLATKSEQWHYRISISTDKEYGIKINQISSKYYTYDKRYVDHRIYNVPDIINWWKDNYIKPGEEKAMNFGLPSRNDIHFIDYFVTGYTNNDQKVSGFCRVYLLKEMMKISGEEDNYNNGSSERSVYDTDLLRYNADFKLAVARGIYWVSTNILGKPRQTKEDLLRIEKTPILLREKITALYEVILYVQIVNFRNADDNIRMKEGNVNWEHHKPGELAITSNEGCCATISNLMNYLLEDDYEEVGFIAFSRKDGNGHVYNYIRDKEYFYIIDLTKYRSDSLVAAVENGDYRSYDGARDKLGSFYQVKDLDDYVAFFRGRANDPPALFCMYEAKNTLPIDSVRSGGTIRITFPLSCKDNVHILYDDPNDSIFYDFVKPPKRYPKEWEPYNYVFQ